MRRIAIWNTAFLGDAALTLPLVRAVAAAWPDAAVDMYVRRGVGALFAAQPELAAVREYDKRASERGAAALWRLGRDVAGRGYDMWLGVHGAVFPGRNARGLHGRAAATPGLYRHRAATFRGD